MLTEGNAKDEIVSKVGVAVTLPSSLLGFILHAASTPCQVLKRLHNHYVDLFSNPFHSSGMPIKSSKFDSQVEAVVASYGATVLAPQ